jgi:hypothetical protein
MNCGPLGAKVLHKKEPVHRDRRGHSTQREKGIVHPHASGERCHRDLMYCDRKVKIHSPATLSVAHAYVSAASLRSSPTLIA